MNKIGAIVLLALSAGGLLTYADFAQASPSKPKMCRPLSSEVESAIVMAPEGGVCPPLYVLIDDRNFEETGGRRSNSNDAGGRGLGGEGSLGGAEGGSHRRHHHHHMAITDMMAKRGSSQG
jgi:hypothetical protein